MLLKHMSSLKTWSSKTFLINFKTGVGIIENLVITQYPSVPKIFFLGGTRYPSVPKLFLAGTLYPAVPNVWNFLATRGCQGTAHAEPCFKVKFQAQWEFKGSFSTAFDLFMSLFKRRQNDRDTNLDITSPFILNYILSSFFQKRQCDHRGSLLFPNNFLFHGVDFQLVSDLKIRLDSSYRRGHKNLPNTGEFDLDAADFGEVSKRMGIRYTFYIMT